MRLVKGCRALFPGRDGAEGRGVGMAGVGEESLVGGVVEGDFDLFGSAKVDERVGGQASIMICHVTDGLWELVGCLVCGESTGIGRGCTARDYSDGLTGSKC